MPPLLVIVPVMVLFAPLKAVRFKVLLNEVLALIITLPAILVLITPLPPLVLEKVILSEFVPVLLNCNVEAASTVSNVLVNGPAVVNTAPVIADCKLTLLALIN